ncbi:hypothetical protein [Gillisia sp. Hel_I_86]|uniref:hypothetical protein n=1 Tax=Gillisia sp. Hel_I_86 TaxID=1249981 RepID=UPI0011A3BD95|nr:hypothetical protein [Gillisia sp. Hel_I_86]
MAIRSTNSLSLRIDGISIKIITFMFGQKYLSWKSVYYHYRKWCPCGFWHECWTKFLERYKSHLHLSSVDLDGSHTPAIRGGEQVEYQGRKKRKTTNALYLIDRQGLPLAMSGPVAGNHKDIFDIEVQFEIVTATLGEAQIPVEGLFPNADAGFDTKEFRRTCDKKKINANICQNKATAIRTGMITSTRNSTMRDLRLNVPMHGWIASVHCSTVSIQQ